MYTLSWSWQQGKLYIGVGNLIDSYQKCTYTGKDYVERAKPRDSATGAGERPGRVAGPTHLHTDNRDITHPNTPTATAASLRARSWSMSTSVSGRIVAVLRGCLSFCTATTGEPSVSLGLGEEWGEGNCGVLYVCGQSVWSWVRSGVRATVESYTYSLSTLFILHQVCGQSVWGWVRSGVEDNCGVLPRHDLRKECAEEETSKGLFQIQRDENMNKTDAIQLKANKLRKTTATILISLYCEIDDLKQGSRRKSMRITKKKPPLSEGCVGKEKDERYKRDPENVKCNP
ncbi:hypothetical protein J6590_044784 [Homalodisca vitripennis]|nr:hypothetical protein J6590_044784 [Homalodisca vitripennis]